MADQRPAFRFRLPWLLSPGPAPAPQPTVETQPPTQPTITSPTQTAPFRSAGLSPSQPSQTESQPSSPSRPVMQFRFFSQPSSPSPSAPKFQAASEPPSLFRASPRPPSVEAQPNIEITSTPVSISQNQTQIISTVQSRESGPTSAIALIPTLAAEKLAQIQKSDSSSISAEKTKEDKDVKEISRIASEEPKQENAAELLTEKLPSVAFQEEQKQIAKQEILDSKEKLTTSIPSEKQIKTTPPSHPKDRSPASKFHQKPSISTGQRAPLHKEIRDDICRLIRKITLEPPKHHLGEKSASFTSLVGENRGAYMHLGSESSERGGTTNGEESSKGRTKIADSKDDQATEAYINSNTQGLNNSILFDSTITERDSGVHLLLSRDLTETIELNNITESLEISKAEFSITSSQRHIYETPVEREYLQDPFVEPSESDTDNPEKPRESWLSQYLQAEDKDNKIDIL